MMARDTFTERLGVMVTKLICFFRREIFFLCRVQVFMHLFYNMFSFVEILYFEVWGCFYHFLRMPALGT